MGACWCVGDGRGNPCPGCPAVARPWGPYRIDPPARPPNPWPWPPQPNTATPEPIVINVYINGEEVTSEREEPTDSEEAAPPEEGTP